MKLKSFLSCICKNIAMKVNQRMYFTGRFRPYDYGVIKNLEVYNRSSPPDYDISKITSPLAMLYGKNDLVTAPKDVEVLANMLPNLVKLHKIEKPPFNHADFVFGKDNDAIVNFEVINILNQYNGKAPMTTTTTTKPEEINKADTSDNVALC
nr:unnamed protein product [Callosobruchus analis]